MEDLRGAELRPDGALPDACELAIDVPAGNFALSLFTKPDGTGGLTLKYDQKAGRCVVDKTGLEKRFNQKVGEVLEVPLEKLSSLRVFIDRSSTEVFFNDGEATFTCHTYPTENERGFAVSGGAKVRLWPMNASVTDAFVV